MVYLIDSNIFLRTLIKENEEIFEQCVTFLTAVKKNKYDAVVPNIVLAEIVWTLGSYYRFSKSEVIRALQSIIHLSGLKIVDGYEIESALEFYGNKNVKFIDTLIASIPEIKNNKWTVVSYDRDFDKMKINRKEPGEII